MRAGSFENLPDGQGFDFPSGDTILSSPEAQQKDQGKVLPGSEQQAPPAEVLEFESQLAGRVSCGEGVVDELPLNEQELMSSIETGFQVTLFILSRSELRNFEKLLLYVHDL